MNIKSICVFLLTAIPLLADDGYSSKVNYFGNLSAAKVNSSGFNINDYNSDNVNNKWKLSPYSKVGVQMSAYNDAFTWTGQVLLKENHNDIELDLTWLNVKYNINDNFMLHLGRIQTNVFLYSASYDIDYIQLWSKAPLEVYRLMPIRTFNGVGITYKKMFDDYKFQATFFTLAHNKDIKINGTKDEQTDLEIDDSSSLSLVFENREFTYKASYSRSIANIEDDASTVMIVNALKEYGNDMGRYTFKDRLIQVYSLGFQYRGDEVLFESEIARSKSNGLLPSSTGAYAILGYKVNKFTPFVMYAENKNDKSHYDTSDVKTYDATSEALKVGLNDTLYVHNFSQKTSSLGFKYDVDLGVAFKAQMDRISTTDYGNISQSSVNALGYESIGALTRDKGTKDKAIYAFTMSLSFAF